MGNLRFKKASESLAPSPDSAEPDIIYCGRSEKLGPFVSLTNANFRWFWVSGLAAGFAMQMRQIARDWLEEG